MDIWDQERKGYGDIWRDMDIRVLTGIAGLRGEMRIRMLDSLSGGEVAWLKRRATQQHIEVQPDRRADENTTGLYAQS